MSCDSRAREKCIRSQPATNPQLDSSAGATKAKCIRSQPATNPQRVAPVPVVSPECIRSQPATNPQLYSRRPKTACKCIRSQPATNPQPRSIARLTRSECIRSQPATNPQRAAHHRLHGRQCIRSQPATNPQLVCRLRNGRRECIRSQPATNPQRAPGCIRFRRQCIRFQPATTVRDQHNWLTSASCQMSHFFGMLHASRTFAGRGDRDLLFYELVSKPARRGGQTQFAPRTPQIASVPAGCETSSNTRQSTPTAFIAANVATPASTATFHVCDRNHRARLSARSAGQSSARFVLRTNLLRRRP